MIERLAGIFAILPHLTEEYYDRARSLHAAAILADIIEASKSSGGVRSGQMHAS